MRLEGLGIVALATFGALGTFRCDAPTAVSELDVLRAAVREAPIASIRPGVERCATPGLSVSAKARELAAPQPRKFPRNGVEIPVYVHVVSHTDGTGNVDDSAIAAQIDVLNAGYAGATGGAATGFRFRLVATTRTVNDFWFGASPFSAADAQMKAALRVGGGADLNLFVNGATNILGYATYPAEYAVSPGSDGVVVRFDTLPNGAFAPFNEGDTATHEVGHWLGLLHTFENGCSNEGDGVRDTPAEAFPASGCPIGRDTCTGGKFKGEDPVTNFMNFSDDACMFEFTQGQANRMQSQWVSFRAGN